MIYIVKAITADDQLISLIADSDSEAAASAHARAQGHEVLSVKRNPFASMSARHKERFSTLLFSQELLALLSAGLSLVEALAALKTKHRYQSQRIVEGLAEAVSEGLAFSAAIARYPTRFSPLYIAAIQSSEKTGNIQEALRRYIDYQQQMNRIRKQIISSCTYPALLLAVGALVVLFLLFYVVPRFARVYENFSGSLPFFSKLLVVLGGSISHYGLAIALGIVAALIVLALLVRRSHAELVLRRAFTLIPPLAENVRLYELTRLYRTLGMLLKGGIPIIQAMTMSESLLGATSRDRFRHGQQLITEGRTISSALAESGLTTSIAERMLAVGERTGNMGNMMERIAIFHEEDLSRSVEQFTKLFEPALMLFIGMIVGTIVVMMYMPIFELATAIQQ